MSGSQAQSLLSFARLEVTILKCAKKKAATAGGLITL